MLRHRPRRILTGSLAILAVVAAAGTVLVAGGAVTLAARTGLAISRDVPLGDPLLVEVPVPREAGLGPGVLVSCLESSGEERVVGEVWSLERRADGSLRLVLRIRDEARPLLGRGAVVRVAYPPRSLREALALLLPAEEREALEDGLARDLSEAFSAEIQPLVSERIREILPEILPSDEEIEEFVAEEFVPDARDEFEGPMREMQDHIVRQLDARLSALDRAGMLWDVVSGDYPGLRDRLLPTVRGAITSYLEVNRPALVRRTRNLLMSYQDPAIRLVTDRFAPPIVDRAVIPVIRENQSTIVSRVGERLREAYERALYAEAEGFRPLFVHAFASRALRKKDAKIWVRPGSTGTRVEAGDELASRVYFGYDEDGRIVTYAPDGTIREEVGPSTPTPDGDAENPTADPEEAATGEDGA